MAKLNTISSTRPYPVRVGVKFIGLSCAINEMSGRKPSCQKLARISEEDKVECALQAEGSNEERFKLTNTAKVSCFKEEFAIEVN